MIVLIGTVILLLGVAGLFEAALLLLAVIVEIFRQLFERN